MSTNKLTSIVRRGTMLGAAFAIVAASFAPAASTFADALNPLTDRSLKLSSSAPGWDDKDGSGNTLYAPPNSGANGRQTGNTFSFRVSTDSTLTGTNEPVKAVTFQYCTTSAGICSGPGNIVDHSESNADNLLNERSDLEIVTSSPTELAALAGVVDTGTGDVISVPTSTNYVVYYNNAGTWTQSTGWVMTAQIAQDGTSTLKNNQITLTKTAGQGFTAGQEVKVVFFATETNFITNPGAGAFFVKINTYKDDVALTQVNVIDGGVTVANVMNLSIQIQTKVLETMEFSVGTVDPFTLASGIGGQLGIATGVPDAAHTPCGRILMGMDAADVVKNSLSMGNPDGEYSLATDVTYSTHSYWRLSSNSSAGATVYYSGNTLSNTVNDKIQAIGATESLPTPGAEQFGLALANGSDLNVPGSTGYTVDYRTESWDNPYEYGADDSAAGLAALRADQVTNVADLSGVTQTGIDASFLASPAFSNASYHAPQLYPLVPATNYDEGVGDINTNYGGAGGADFARFAFDETSDQIPVPLATQSSQVVDCVTGKMRYIANIAATTPAGIYTTKINYIAAPQY
jgi:hypothetical protein